MQPVNFSIASTSYSAVILFEKVRTVYSISHSILQPNISKDSGYNPRSREVMQVFIFLSLNLKLTYLSKSQQLSNPNLTNLRKKYSVWFICFLSKYCFFQPFVFESIKYQLNNQKIILTLITKRNGSIFN